MDASKETNYAGIVATEGGGIRNIDLGEYVYWNVGEAAATLDGEFTVKELRFIADHMEKENANVK